MLKQHIMLLGCTKDKTLILEWTGTRINFQLAPANKYAPKNDRYKGVNIWAADVVNVLQQPEVFENLEFVVPNPGQYDPDDYVYCSKDSAKRYSATLWPGLSTQDADTLLKFLIGAKETLARFNTHVVHGSGAGNVNIRWDDHGFWDKSRNLEDKISEYLYELFIDKLVALSDHHRALDNMIRG